MTVCEIGYKYSYPSYILWIKWDATFKHLPPYSVNNSTELPYLPTRLYLTSLISSISRTHPDSISFGIQRIYSFTGHLMTVNKSPDIFLISMETYRNWEAKTQRSKPGTRRPAKLLQLLHQDHAVCSAINPWENCRSRNVSILFSSTFASFPLFPKT